MITFDILTLGVKKTNNTWPSLELLENEDFNLLVQGVVFLSYPKAFVGGETYEYLN